MKKHFALFSVLATRAIIQTLQKIIPSTALQVEPLTIWKHRHTTNLQVVIQTIIFWFNSKDTDTDWAITIEQRNHLALVKIFTGRPMIDNINGSISEERCTRIFSVEIGHRSDREIGGTHQITPWVKTEVYDLGTVTSSETAQKVGQRMNFVGSTQIALSELCSSKLSEFAMESFKEDMCDIPDILLGLEKAGIIVKESVEHEP